MDWLLSGTGEGELDQLFTDLCQQKALTFTTDHQKNLLEDSRQGETVKNIQLDQSLEDPAATNQVLGQLREEYGQDRLESMSDRELFELYRARAA